MNVPLRAPGAIGTLVIAPSDARRVRVPQGPPEDCRGGERTSRSPGNLLVCRWANPRRRGSLREALPQVLGGSERKRTNQIRHNIAPRAIRGTCPPEEDATASDASAGSSPSGPTRYEERG